jgi:hypothetical protein
MSAIAEASATLRWSDMRVDNDIQSVKLSGTGYAPMTRCRKDLQAPASRPATWTRLDLQAHAL